MVDTTVKLVTPSEEYRDENGIWQVREPIEREIFAQVNTVDRREFFSGGTAGFRPEYQFIVFAAEYQGEELCEYEGKLYSVYRTYHVPSTDYLELYVQRKVGVSNGQ